MDVHKNNNATVDFKIQILQVSNLFGDYEKNVTRHIWRESNKICF